MEGKNYFDIFRIQRGTIGRDLTVLLGLMFIIGPLSYFPNIWLASALFDNPLTALDLILQPLPLWAVYVGIVAFPVTQGLVELALYFLCVTPRLDPHPFPDLRPLLQMKSLEMREKATALGNLIRSETDGAAKP